jgi:hypothetical protein
MHLTGLEKLALLPFAKSIAKGVWNLGKAVTAPPLWLAPRAPKTIGGHLWRDAMSLPRNAALFGAIEVPFQGYSRLTSPAYKARVPGTNISYRTRAPRPSEPAKPAWSSAPGMVSQSSGLRPEHVLRAVQKYRG